MKSIRTVIEQTLAEYFETVHASSNDVSLKITQSWLTLSRKGESHHTHTHPNSVVSGVLYINLAQNDGINFYRNEDNIWYELLREKETYYNTTSYHVSTKVGDIILFPSNVHHGVKPVTENVERVSLSFNTFFSGTLGKKEFANGLSINLG